MEESQNTPMKTDQQQASHIFELQKANQFLQCQRGRYIVGRALYETYLKVKEEEPSDASDMKFLGETLFQIGWLSASVMRDANVIRQIANARKLFERKLKSQSRKKSAKK